MNQSINTRCLSRTELLFIYLRQNSQINSFCSRAYSWGYGDEYQVSISYLPNSMAAGHRITGTEPGDAIDVEDSALGLSLLSFENK